MRRQAWERFSDSFRIELHNALEIVPPPASNVASTLLPGVGRRQVEQLRNLVGTSEPLFETTYGYLCERIGGLFFAGNFGEVSTQADFLVMLGILFDFAVV